MEPYVRTRENPYFDGLRRSGDMGETRRKSFVSDTSEEVMELSLENSAVSGFNYESSEHSSSERWLKTSKIAPFIQLDIQSELIEPANPKHLGYGHSPRTPEADEKHQAQALQSPAITNIEKTYTVTRRKEKPSSILLPLSAASYYIGVSPKMEIVESCESIDKLNAYLTARKDDVNAGVPGKFLHAVMGSDGAA
ncbi:prune-like isoform X2 [Spatholobus suberectus]|nr:prune-like isoform X2 [Spatholobus suberectus]